MSIQERAKICANKVFDWCYNTSNNDPNGVTNAIIKALEEQQEIDIQRVKEFVQTHLFAFLGLHTSTQVDYLVKDLIKAMKGE